MKEMLNNIFILF